MVEDKLTFRLIRNEEKVNIIIFNLESKFLFKIINVSCNIKLQVTISAIHLMFPDSLWIINVVQYAFAPASISSGLATHQGTLSYFYPMRTRKYYRSTYVLHPSRTSSVTKQTETSLKIYFSISETIFDHGRPSIKVKNIFNSTYFKDSKITKRLKYLSFQKINGEPISCIFSTPSHLVSLKFVCKLPPSIYTVYEKLKPVICKQILTKNYERTLFKPNVLVISLQKTCKNLLNLNSPIFFKYSDAYKRFFSIISNTALIATNNGDI